LPGRTRIAFVVMSVIGISWIGLATWALTTHKPLAARDRVIAGWMAVVFTSGFLAFTVLTVFISRNAAGLSAVLMGLVLLGVAIRALRKARQKFAELSARRVELQRLLGD
jgi:cytochrome bd-type quinol oxidase subunit 2